MNTWLRHLWDRMRSSFWFVPTVMGGLAIALAFGMVAVDEANLAFTRFIFGFNRGPQGARAVLSVIAGSVITVAGVTFSITITALVLASSQFGPRLLRNFIRDRGNQCVLGTFIATFVYCLLVLRRVNGTDANIFVPHIAVTGGIVLAIVSMAVLIYFIHHISHTIQADSVIAAVADEMCKTIERIFPEKTPELSTRDSDPPEFEKAFLIRSPKSGYLQMIDHHKLILLAGKHPAIIQITLRPGLFVTRGSAIAAISAQHPFDASDENAVCAAFVLGPQRTLLQDVAFAFDQLVEIALRALSPGINDTFTALNCLDRLGQGLCCVAERAMPPAKYTDTDGNVRLLTSPMPPADFVPHVFTPIRQNARGNTVVLIRMLETFMVILAQTDDPEFRAALTQQADMIMRSLPDAVPEAHDRSAVFTQYRAFQNLLSQHIINSPI